MSAFVSAQELAAAREAKRQAQEDLLHQVRKGDSGLILHYTHRRMHFLTSIFPHMYHDNILEKARV